MNKYYAYKAGGRMGDGMSEAECWFEEKRYEFKNLKSLKEFIFEIFIDHTSYMYGFRGRNELWNKSEKEWRKKYWRKMKKLNFNQLAKFEREIFDFDIEEDIKGEYADPWETSVLIGRNNAMQT